MEESASQSVIRKELTICPPFGYPLLCVTSYREESVFVSGSSLREAIESLETQYPRVKDRLYDREKIRPNISVMVDGHVSHLKMREKLMAESEVHFVIAISGGNRTNMG